MTEESLWDIFIILNDEVYLPSTIASENYDHFISTTRKHSWEITAQELELTEYETNKITGYSIKAAAKRRGVLTQGDVIETGRHYLDELIALLNLRTDPNLNPQEKLSELRRNARHNL